MREKFLPSISREIAVVSSAERARKVTLSLLRTVTVSSYSPEKMISSKIVKSSSLENLGLAASVEVAAGGESELDGVTVLTGLAGV